MRGVLDGCGWRGDKIIGIAEDEFLHPLPHQRIRHFQQGTHSPMQSPEEIQKLTLPADYSIEQTLIYIMNKGVPVQLPFVIHHSCSYSPISIRPFPMYSPSFAPRHNSRAKTKPSLPNLSWK